MVRLPRWRGTQRPRWSRADDDRSRQIAEFWAWWALHRTAFADQLHVGDLTHAKAAELAAAVNAVHPDLVWEIGSGDLAAHALVVSAGGVAELRALAERWYRAGPGNDLTWEYHPARQACPTRFGDRITLEGESLELARTVVGAFADDRRAKIDVSVFNPVFDRLGAQARAQAAFLTLDWALGEDDVERWVGAVEVATAEPMDAVPATTLGSVVRQLRERWGGERWALLEGQAPDGQRVLAAARHPLSRVDHPLLDEHVMVTLPFEPDESGLPKEQSLEELRGFEQHMLARLGSSAVLVGHETGGGRRVLHLYGERRHSVAPRIEALLPAHRGPAAASVVARPDPAWQETAHLRP
jgi:hypothetical protein